MTVFYLNIFMALVWIFLTGELNLVNFFEGFVVSFIVLFVVRKSLPNDNYFRKIPKVIGFIGYFLKELIVSNLILAYDIITPKDYMTPGIVAIELDAKTDFEITLLASLITLTPGTLSIDVSDDKSKLYVHSVYIKNKDVSEFKKSIKNGMEKKLLEVLR